MSDNQLKVLGEKFAARDVDVWLVGGAVRDRILGVPFNDVDLMVHNMVGAVSVVMYDLNQESIEECKITGFGTTHVVWEGLDIDIATMRKEVYPWSGSLPDVSEGTLYEDMARRDFTINAMAMSIHPESFGRIYDPFDGQSDLGDKCIRFLHGRSFMDDATRILRMYRYMGKYGFEAEALTGARARTQIDYLNTISPHRLRAEFMKLIATESGLMAVQDRGELLGQIAPGLGGYKHWFSDPLETLGILSYTVEDSEGLIDRLQLRRPEARVVRWVQRLRNGEQVTHNTPSQAVTVYKHINS